MKKGDLVMFKNSFGQTYLAISDNEVIAKGEGYSWPAYNKWCHYYYKVNKSLLKICGVLSENNTVPEGIVKLDFSGEICYMCNEKII